MLLASPMDFEGSSVPTARVSVECGTITGVGRMGGDVDLVVGETVVEIKCVVDPKRASTRALQQPLVYAARLSSQSDAILLPRQHRSASTCVGMLGYWLRSMSRFALPAKTNSD